MIKAFISHSSKQKDFAIELANCLGRDYCMVDCYSFETAFKSINEIYKAIEKSTIFVLLISKDSLESKWVNEEIKYAKDRLKKDEYARFWPFIIDDSIKIEDCPEWMKNEECFNLKHFSSPYILARDIEQKFRKIIWLNNPKIKMLETTMVGRNKDISKFEGKFWSENGAALRALIISGRSGVGKETFAKQCMYKVGYELEQIPYKINMDVKDNVENFIIALNMITCKYNKEGILAVLKLSPKEKAKKAVHLLNELYETRSVVFIEDNMACVLPNREIPNWLEDIIKDEELSPQLGLYIQSNIIPNSYIEVDNPQIAHISLQPLDKTDRRKLFYSYIRANEIENVSDEDVTFFIDKLLQSPVQIKQAVEAIKTSSMELAKKDVQHLVLLGDKKIAPLMEHYKENEQRDILVIMSRFDFISYDLLEDIFENRIKEVLDTILDMMVYGIVSTFGPSDRFYRLDHYLSDYIQRNEFSLPEDLEIHLNDVLEKNLEDSKDITKDTSLYLYETKKKIISGNSYKDDYLIPSIVIKSVIDLYNNREYKHVITICEKVVKDSHNYYEDVNKELTYWLCLALCRTQDKDRFFEEVKKIGGADSYFLKGFYFRISTEYKKAESFFNKALDINPMMQRAKREMVTVLMAQRKYNDALSLAYENYDRDSDNTYHIYAYFRCLVKKINLDLDEKKTLLELIDRIKNSYSNKREELCLAMRIEYDAYVTKKSPMTIIGMINNSVADFPESIDIKRVAHEYKLKQSLINKDMVFEEE